MSFTEPFVGSRTVSTTEISLLSGTNYSTPGTPPSVQTTAGKYWIMIDVVNVMVAGDQFTFTVYEKINAGTAFPLVPPITKTGKQVSQVIMGPLVLKDGFDLSAIRVAGTDRSIGYSVRAETIDVNVASFNANAITATAINAAAITATKFATDAIDSNALAASAVTEIQTGLALAATALSNADYTAARAAKLDNLDATVSTRAASATAVSNVDLTSARAAKLDNLDAAVSTRAPSSTAVSSADYTTGRAANLDAAISTRAAAATALSTVQWTNQRATNLDNLDATVSSRAASATAVSNADLTSARAAKLDNLDATVSSRALASTAVSSADYTAARAAKLDNADATISSRAASATAVSNADYTSARAAKLDNLDATTSSRASASALTAVDTDVLSRASASAVASVQADTDDIQTRLPAALDGSGNIKAGVQSLASGALTSIAVAVMASVVETGLDVTGSLRLLLSEAVGKLAGVLAGTYRYRDVGDTKDRIVGTVTSDGRTSVTLDAS